MKRYDAAYFRRYYLDRRTRLLTPRARRRRVAVAVATAERWLGRELRSTLDVGCGLGLWGRELARLRPRASYLGLDPSPALAPGRRGRVELRRGSFAEVAALPARRRFDLVVCADVLHYLDPGAVDAALAALVPRARGVLALDLLTSAEPIEGDRDGLRVRSPGFWRARCARYGLVAVGQHLYLAPALAELTAALDRVDSEGGRRIGRP
jgi:SAM-dependent methyltransferase